MDDDNPFFTVILPWPPSQNLAIMPVPKRRKGGKIGADIIHTKAANDWKAQANKACAEAHTGIHSLFVGTKCVAHLTLMPPNNRADIDAGIKKTLDALQGYAYTNDRQVKLLIVSLPEDDETFGEAACVVARVWEKGKPSPFGDMGIEL